MKRFACVLILGLLMGVSATGNYEIVGPGGALTLSGSETVESGSLISMNLVQASLGWEVRLDASGGAEMNYDQVTFTYQSFFGAGFVGQPTSTSARISGSDFLSDIPAGSELLTGLRVEGTGTITVTDIYNENAVLGSFAVSGPAAQYSLTASVVGGHGSVAPTGGTYDAETEVALTATPENGYQVASWSGTDNDTSTANTNTVTMNSTKTVTVTFEEIPATTYALTASVASGQGSISPTTGSYADGTVVTLTATPADGWHVQSWSGQITIRPCRQRIR